MTLTSISSKQKALAYITRKASDGTHQLLVHVHRDFPEAGIQVPAGTIEPDETPEEGCLREALEESGLKKLRIVEKLGHREVKAWWDSGKIHSRHFFHVLCDDTMPDAWSHTVTSGTADKDLVFNYFWVPLDGESNLEVDQGALIWRLREILGVS